MHFESGNLRVADTRVDPRLPGSYVCTQLLSLVEWFTVGMLSFDLNSKCPLKSIWEKLGPQLMT